MARFLGKRLSVSDEDTTDTTQSSSSKRMCTDTATNSKDNANSCSSSSTDLTQSEKPNHPDASVIPSQDYGSGDSRRTLKFQNSWWKKYPWLHWDSKKVLCFYCATIKPEKVAHLKKCDTAFSSNGYSNLKKAHEKFSQHETSAGHKEAVSAFVNREKPSVVSLLNKQVADEQLRSQRCLSVIFTTLKYIGRQGIAVRGHDYDEGNFIELLRTRANDVPDMKMWLSKLDNTSAKKKHLLSPDIQNEILSDYSRAVISKLQADIHKSSSFALICDGTQDCAGIEQQSICIRHVDKELYPKENFIGLYELTDTDGATLTKMLLDVCIRLSLPLEKLRGQTYDGASNMSGIYKGVQAQILQHQPLAYYMHCAAHQVNLVCQNVVSANTWIRDCLTCVNELGMLFSSTIKYRNIYGKLVLNEAKQTKKLKPMCPTRWTVRHGAILNVLENYGKIMDTLEEFENLKTISSEQKSKANSLLTILMKGSTLMALQCGEKVFGLLHVLSKTLQSRSATIEGTMEAVNVTISGLLSLRDNYNLFFKENSEKITELQLETLELPRQRKPPKRFSGAANSYTGESAEEHYRKQFFEVIDTAQGGLNQRFTKGDSSGLRSYFDLQQCLQGDIKEEVVKYPEINKSRLVMEISMFVEKFGVSTVKEAAEALRSAHPEVREMFSQTEQLVRLLLVRPSTSCEAERSFSGLRRLKTWLRSTMSARRLNSVAVLHCHQDLLDEVDDTQLMRQFIARNDFCRHVGNL